MRVKTSMSRCVDVDTTLTNRHTELLTMEVGMRQMSPPRNTTTILLLLLLLLLRVTNAAFTNRQLALRRVTV